MEHLFEPFFTTRGTQSGTGLGLAVVFGAVAEIKGAIDVESTPGSGACFTLYLPECFDALSPVDTPLNQTQRGSGETILVVDDEPELVGLSEESLRGLGYSPEGFIDPVAALKAFQEAPQRYAAVITDEMMPGLSGTELTRRLRELSPEVPVLLVSGYGGAALAERAESAGVTKVLSKPLRRATLALALAELLRASRPR